MINLSLAVWLPDSWKFAVITMIPKKGSMSNDPGDYRGISLFSCVGKLAKRVIKNRLYFFLESKKLIVNQQSGFRNNRGTTDKFVYLGVLGMYIIRFIRNSELIVFLKLK